MMIDNLMQQLAETEAITASHDGQDGKHHFFVGH